MPPKRAKSTGAAKKRAAKSKGSPGKSAAALSPQEPSSPTNAGAESEAEAAAAPPGPPPYTDPAPGFVLLDAVRYEAANFDEYSIQAIYEAIRDGEDVNQFTVHGYTPLAVAAATGSADLVAFLLEKGADVRMACIGRSESPLHHAARFGHRLVLELLLPHAIAHGLIDRPNNTGHPPLHLACAAGHFNVVKILLRAKASPSSCNHVMGGVTPLHAAVGEDNAETIEFLLDKDAEIDQPDRHGRSPLHTAALRCNTEVMSVLLRSRANPVYRDPDGVTPMDLVPVDHKGRERALQMLNAFSRRPPEPPRTDPDFWRRDERSLF